MSAHFATRVPEAPIDLQEVALTPVALPEFGSLNPALRARLHAFDRRLPAWRCLTGPGFLESHGVLRESGTVPWSLLHLDHPCGPDYRVLARVREENFYRSAEEQAALSRLPSARSGSFDVVNDIALLSSALQNDAVLRQERSASARNRAGWRVVYPDHRVVQDELLRLSAWVTRNASLSATWTACLAMVSVSTLHPLRDGNGRLSRMVFNALLRTHGLQQSCYVPLSEIFASCPGGKELREKTGYYTGDWNPLISYMLDALQAATWRPSHPGAETDTGTTMSA